MSPSDQLDEREEVAQKKKSIETDAVSEQQAIGSPRIDCYYTKIKGIAEIQYHDQESVHLLFIPGDVSFVVPKNAIETKQEDNFNEYRAVYSKPIDGNSRDCPKSQPILQD